MAVGDISNPKRVRTQANERLDTVDAESVSISAREHLDAYGRAVEVAPLNVGSSTPTGLIVQGFGFTLNPTGPSDAKVRVQSPVGVAFDANGRLLIKENGVQVDLTVPTGNSQIYVYYIESNSDTSIRRFIPVGPPFTPESGNSIATKLKGDVAFLVQAGDQTSIVASEVGNGATAALRVPGVAHTSGGVVTMTDYDSVAAPNGIFTTNRITTVAQPTLPLSPAANGSIATMHGLINAALYIGGQAMWKGLENFELSALSNFGAYTIPPFGVATVERNKLSAFSSLLGSVANTGDRPDFGGDDGATPSPLWTYCLSQGQAFLRKGSANNLIQIAAGTLLQVDQSSTNQNFVSYHFQGTETFPALTNGDATNPRCDLLQLKLSFDPVTGVTPALTVKVGTPAASPRIPDPDAGFTPVGVAVVGHTWVAGTAPVFGQDVADINKVVIHDQRMPLGVRTWVVDPTNWKLETAFSLQDINTNAKSSNATCLMWALCPTTTGRIIGVDVQTSATLTTAGNLGTFTFDLTGPGSPPSANFFAGNSFGSNVAPAPLSGFKRARRVDFEALHTPANGPTILPSTVNSYGVPMWASGYRTPQPNDVAQMMLRIQNIP